LKLQLTTQLAELESFRKQQNSLLGVGSKQPSPRASPTPNIQQAVQKASILEDELNLLKLEYQNQKNQLEQLTIENSNLKESARKQQQQHHATVASLELKVQTLTTEIETIKKEKEQQLRHHAQQILNLKTECENVKKENESLRNEIEILRKEKMDATKQNNENKTNSLPLNQQPQQSQQQIASSDTSGHSGYTYSSVAAEYEIKRLNLQVENMKFENEKLELANRRLSAYEKEIDLLKDTNAQLSKQIDQLREEKHHLLSNFDQAVANELRLLKKDIESLQKEKQRLETRLKEEESKRMATEDKLEKREKDHRNELDSLLRSNRETLIMLEKEYVLRIRSIINQYFPDKEYSEKKSNVPTNSPSNKQTSTHNTESASEGNILHFPKQKSSLSSSSPFNFYYCIFFFAIFFF
jgi:chromosome segregation ATPase